MIEPCRQAVAFISSPLDMDTWVAAMHTAPARFTDREAGLHHFVTGRAPHHERDCNSGCPIGETPAPSAPRRTR